MRYFPGSSHSLHWLSARCILPAWATVLARRPQPTSIGIVDLVKEDIGHTLNDVDLGYSLDFLNIIESIAMSLQRMRLRKGPLRGAEGGVITEPDRI